MDNPLWTHTAQCAVIVFSGEQFLPSSVGGGVDRLLYYPITYLVNRLIRPCGILYYCISTVVQLRCPLLSCGMGEKMGAKSELSIVENLTTTIYSGISCELGTIYSGFEGVLTLGFFTDQKAVGVELCHHGGQSRKKGVFERFKGIQYLVV